MDRKKCSIAEEYWRYNTVYIKCENIRNDISNVYQQMFINGKKKMPGHDQHEIQESSDLQEGERKKNEVRRGFCYILNVCFLKLSQAYMTDKNFAFDKLGLQLYWWSYYYSLFSLWVLVVTDWLAAPYTNTDRGG